MNLQGLVDVLPTLPRKEAMTLPPLPQPQPTLSPEELKEMFAKSKMAIGYPELAQEQIPIDTMPREQEGFNILPPELLFQLGGFTPNDMGFQLPGFSPVPEGLENRDPYMQDLKEDQGFNTDLSKAMKQPYEMTQEEFGNIPVIKYIRERLNDKANPMNISERNQLAKQLVDSGIMSIDDFNAMTGQHGFGGVSGAKNLTTGKPISSKPIDTTSDMGAKINYIGQWHTFRNVPLFAHREAIVKALAEGKTVPQNVLDSYKDWSFPDINGQIGTLKEAVESYGGKMPKAPTAKGVLTNQDLASSGVTDKNFQQYLNPAKATEAQYVAAKQIQYYNEKGGVLPIEQAQEFYRSATAKGGEIWYHGTDKDFIDIDMNKSNTNPYANDFGKGLYLTGDKTTAGKYGKIIKEFRVEGKIFDGQRKLSEQEVRDIVDNIDTFKTTKEKALDHTLYGSTPTNLASLNFYAGIENVNNALKKMGYVGVSFSKENLGINKAVNIFDSKALSKLSPKSGK